MGERPALACIVKKDADILRYLYRGGRMDEERSLRIHTHLSARAH